MQNYKPLYHYKRIKTLPVQIGNIILGSDYPIRLQSMTNTSTDAIEATVKQCIKIFDAGADFVRITVPSIKDIENFKLIKIKLHEAGYKKPLIADVHFNYKIAYEVAKIAEKVRINPGNFIPSNTQTENLENKIEEKFVPLLEICKQYGTALRIGVNHGSLPSYILEKYGDTPQGMVETAMQFLRICKKYNFHNVVCSMKASNPLIMVYSNRLLISKMLENNIVYPIHVGVTEAGYGDEGRIKSAIGIGCLLIDGIGDTIRVSLTEEPDKEIPVGKIILNYLEEKKNLKTPEINPSLPINPYEYYKINTLSISNFGGKNLFRVILNVDNNYNNHNISNIRNLLEKISTNSLNENLSVDAIFLNNVLDYSILQNISTIKIPIFIHYQKIKNIQLYHDNIIPVLSPTDFLSHNVDNVNSLMLSLKDLNDELLKKLKNSPNTILIIENDNETDIYGQRALIYHFINNKIFNPIILKRNYENISSLEELQIKASIDYSIFLIDGLCDGLLITCHPDILFEEILSTSYNILQATRRRITKTEFISCPSCGRTHFNIIEIVKTIKEKLGHLKGIKIAVMGCNVNGPGEMADADYGYVGSGPGKVNLYKGKEIVKRNIPESEALDELINLIKSYGDWIEKY